MRLHRVRLEVLSRTIEEAIERKRRQGAAREAWLADQAYFGTGETGGPEAE